MGIALFLIFGISNIGLKQWCIFRNMVCSFSPWLLFLINSVQTRGIAKTSRLAKVFVRIGDAIKFKGFHCGVPREQAPQRKSKPPRKSPEKSMSLSLAFYNTSRLHIVDISLQTGANVAATLVLFQFLSLEFIEETLPQSLHKMFARVMSQQFGFNTWRCAANFTQRAPDNTSTWGLASFRVV